MWALKNNETALTMRKQITGGDLMKAREFQTLVESGLKPSRIKNRKGESQRENKRRKGKLSPYRGECRGRNALNLAF